VIKAGLDDGDSASQQFVTQQRQSIVRTVLPEQSVAGFNVVGDIS
jgi:hypothetical protein